MADTYVADLASDLFVDAPSARFGYRRIGPVGGVPLVLLNRHRGTLDWWDPRFLERLSRDRDVIYVDNVGIGYTSGVPRDSVQAMAAGIIEFLDALGIAQADLLGWSLGGMVAQHVALKAPERVRRLVVAASTPGGRQADAPPASEKALGIMAKPEPDAADLVALLFADTEAGRASGYAHVTRVVPRLTPDTPGVSPEASGAGLAAIGGFAGLAADDVRKNLESASHPVLFATALDDELIPAVDSLFAVRHVNAPASLLAYSEGGHGFLFQHIDTFTAQVDAFLSEDADVAASVPSR